MSEEHAESELARTESMALDVSRRALAEVSTLLDEVRETLQDLASGEVVGALWDETRALRSDVSELREVLAAAAPAQAQPSTDSLAADIAALRDELSSGLVVEASDDLGGSIDAVQRDVEAIKARLDQPLELAADESEAASGEAVAAVVDQVAALRDFASTEFAALRQLQASGPDVDLTEVHEALAEIRSAVAERGESAPPVDLTEVHEALADIQSAVAHLLDRPVPASAPESSEEPGVAYATVDPDVIDLLREEIRAAGEPAEGLIDALNTELKALRRRIRLRAEDELFTDEQLDRIAESVARRLAADDS